MGRRSEVMIFSLARVLVMRPRRLHLAGHERHGRLAKGILGIEGIAGHQVLHEGPDVVLEPLDRLLPGLRPFEGRRHGQPGHPAGLPGEDVPEGLQVEPLLAAEVVGHEGRVGLGPQGDLADAGPIEALLGEGQDRGLDQALPRIKGCVGRLCVHDPSFSINQSNG